MCVRRLRNDQASSLRLLPTPAAAERAGQQTGVLISPTVTQTRPEVFSSCSPAEHTNDSCSSSLHTVLQTHSGPPQGPSGRTHAATPTPHSSGTCSCGGSCRRNAKCNHSHIFPTAGQKKNLHLNLNRTPPSINKHGWSHQVLLQEHLEGSTCGVQRPSSAGECSSFLPIGFILILLSFSPLFFRNA